MPENYAATISETNAHYHSVTSRGRQFPVFPKELNFNSDADVLDVGQDVTAMEHDDDDTDVDGGVPVDGLDIAETPASEWRAAPTFQFNLPIRALPS